MSPRIDLTNQTFGVLKVLEYSHSNTRGKAFWKCLCQCGTETVVVANNLRVGKTKSCGCRLSNVGKHSIAWKGYEDIPGNYWKELRNRCKRKNMTLSITMEYMWEIFLLQDRKCALSGEILQFSTASKRYDGTASLDRIDNTKGYIEGNVQWLHKDVNKMKNTHVGEDFVQWCKKIAHFNSIVRNG